MTTPAGELFVALVVVVAIGVIGLARATAALLDQDEPLVSGSDRPALESGPAMFLNLTATHMGIAFAIGGIVWLTGVPVRTLGLVGLPEPGNALLLGIGIYGVNEGLAAVATTFGGEAPERYRAFLAPEDRRSWTILLLVVLPTVAFAEELLFRGALVGGVAATTALSPWALAVVSSVGFGAAHSAQGRFGIGVATVLGFVLAAAFVVTGDLMLVAVAHYLVNALEFVVHEGLGFEWYR